MLLPGMYHASVCISVPSYVPHNFNEHLSFPVFAQNKYQAILHLHMNLFLFG